MTPTEEFIEKLEKLRNDEEGELARLRRLLGRRLDDSLEAFDLFAGLWWPLRQENQRAPRREVSWLIAKLYAAFPIARHEGSGSELPAILGRREPREGMAQARFRARFDALLCLPLTRLEPHLRWALGVAARAVDETDAEGLHWVKLVDDLSLWDSGRRGGRQPNLHEKWAEQYLKAAGNTDRRGA